MSDRLISADALADRLDSLAYDDWNQGASTSWANAYSECAEMVRSEMPTVDAVEVVRCKECKHSSDEYKTNGGVWKTDDRHLFCKMTNHLMRVEDFCSWGERREP